MTTPITTFPITGYTISDLALVSPAAGQSLEVGGSSDGRVDIDALATYCRAGFAWSDLAATPTTLAGYGITDAQPLDADLTALAGLSTTGAIERTGAGTAATFTVSAFAKTLLDDADAATARSTLGLVIGTNVQAWSTRLDSVAGLSATSGGIEKTAANTFGTYTLTAFAKTLLDDADAATARTTLGLVIGTNVQAWSTRLDSVAGLSATSGGIEKTAANTFGTYTLTAFAKTLLDDADAATARATLGLGTIATQSAATVAITGGSITGITDLAVADGGTGSSTAAGARTNLGAAASDHTHLADQSVITLTPINSFTSLGSPYRNALTVIPALKLAILEFAVSHASLPASDVALFTWSASYTASTGLKGFPVVISLTGASAAPIAFAYVDGNSLKWNLGNAYGGTNIAYLLGTIAFTYA